MSAVEEGLDQDWTTLEFGKTLKFLCLESPEWRQLMRETVQKSGPRLHAYIRIHSRTSLMR